MSQSFNFMLGYSDKYFVKKISSFLNLLIISLVLVIGAIVFYAKNAKEPVSHEKINTTELSSQDLDSIVNKHIKSVNEEALKTKIMAEKSMIETQNKLAELERLNKIKQDKENASIPIDRQIRKDVQNEIGASPADMINAKIYEKNQQDEMDAAEKKEYARQWIQNARKAGYLLELSEDLEVIKYTPIRKPSQQDDSATSYPSD